MKANEAPEKLYLGSKQRPDKEIFHVFTTTVENDDIEYIRKDAFIEEVCKYLQENCTYIHPRKGTTTCAVNLTLLKEYLENKV